MKTFYKLLFSSLLAGTTNYYVWFALTYFAYLQTRSVISTGIVGGMFLAGTVLSSFWFGSIVDHNKKKHAMLGSSVASLTFFAIGFIIFLTAPQGAFSHVASPYLWAFIMILLCGTTAGNIYNIALPTLVTVLVPEDRRDKANGLLGSVMGVAFALTSVFSGVVLGYWGMYWILVTAILATLLAILYLALTPVPEKNLPAGRQEIIHTTSQPAEAVLAGKTSEEITPAGRIDIKGTISAVKAIPGLLGLILFNTFNNFLGGVFMALMDAYGLSLVSVQVWGFLWGFLSMGFIIGGLIIAKKGLGKNPVRTLFLTNIIMWTVCIFFTIQHSIILLSAGMLIYLILIPFVESSEQTIIQKVVPQERQGRVFGFAQSVEQAASPLTAFMIGPIAQFIFIPFMTTGRGVDLIGGWFGTGPGRGLALVFTLTGIIGLAITLLAMRSNSYKLLSKRYLQKK
jgi:MFS transporter, DHA3 family, multidrug efflux protein